MSVVLVLHHCHHRLLSLSRSSLCLSTACYVNGLVMSVVLLCQWFCYVSGLVMSMVLLCQWCLFYITITTDLSHSQGLHSVCPLLVMSMVLLCQWSCYVSGLVMSMVLLCQWSLFYITVTTDFSHSQGLHSVCPLLVMSMVFVFWSSSVVVSTLASINEVNLCQTRLVPWATMSRFGYR